MPRISVQSSRLNFGVLEGEKIENEIATTGPAFGAQITMYKLPMVFVHFSFDT